jgi:hypothetical protein
MLSSQALDYFRQLEGVLMKRVLSLLLVISISAAPAFSQTGDKSSILLTDVTSVDVQTQVGGTGATACGISETRIRSYLINELVPAGLKVDSASLWTINVQTISGTTSTLCATAISFGNLYFGQVENVFNQKSAFLPGQIDRKLGIYTSVPSEHEAMVGAAVARLTREVLAVWREVNSGSPIVRQVQPPPANRPAVSGAATLSVVDVRDAQRALQRLGYYAGAVDGAVGPGTRNAITQFQRANGLVANGELNEATLSALRDR